MIAALMSGATRVCGGVAAALALCTFLVVIPGCENSDGPGGPPDTSRTSACPVDSPGIQWWFCDNLDPQSPVHFGVLCPAGGQVLYVGDTVVVKFCSSDPDYYDIDMADKQLSVDNKVTWYTLSVTPKDRGFVWVVPDSLYDKWAGNMSAVSSSCYLKITVYSGGGDPTTDFAVSKEPFEIRMR